MEPVQLEHDHVLVTGFEPFGTVEVNASAEVAAALGQLCRTAILPTSYRRAAIRRAELVAEFKPSVLLMLGHADMVTGLRIETRGRAEVTADKFDNDGVNLLGERHGPDDQLLATVSVDELAEIGRRVGLEVELSDDAGGYVCNSLLYGALSAPPPRPRSIGFVHLGPLGPADATGESADLLERYVEAISLMVDHLARTATVA